jgi:5-methylcytosine-specific restriction endonuclease McrA
MPKYRKRGMLRKVCSYRCAKIAHPTTHEQAKRAQQTKWKGHTYKSHQNAIARGKSEYTEWRKAVFARDNYTCQKCGARNGDGVGRTIKLHAHHIKHFATHHDLRYEPSNGITLCESCHRKEHKHVFIGRTPKTTQGDASSRTSDKT